MQNRIEAIVHPHNQCRTVSIKTILPADEVKEASQLLRLAIFEALIQTSYPIEQYLLRSSLDLGDFVKGPSKIVFFWGRLYYICIYIK